MTSYIQKISRVFRSTSQQGAAVMKKIARLTTSAIVVAALSSLCMGTAQAAVVAWYKLDGNANDSSGNGYNGSATDVSWVADGPSGAVASFAGGNGAANSTINVSSSHYSVTESPNFQFAISMWLLPTARQDYFAGGATDVNIVMGASNGGVIELPGQGSWLSNPGGIGVNSGSGGGSSGRPGTINIYDGNWHHFVIQWVDPDGTVAGNVGALAQIWIDGTSLTVDGSYTGNGATTPQMNLGGPVVWSNGGVADKYYKGLMSDVRFHNAQLTQGDVDALAIPEWVWDGTDGIWQDTTWLGYGTLKRPVENTKVTIDNGYKVTLNTDWTAATGAGPVNSLNIGASIGSSLLVDTTGALDVTNGVTVGAGSTLTVNGTLDATTVAVAGILKGSGTITGDVVISDGGIMAPGNSPGVLTVDGNLNFVDTELAGVPIYNWEASNADEYDQVFVKNGTLTIDDALVINLTTFEPKRTIGETFVLFDSTDNASFAGNPSLWTVNVLGPYMSGTPQITVENNQIILSGISFIPEPSTMILAGLGLAGLMIRRPARAGWLEAIRPSHHRRR